MKSLAEQYGVCDLEYAKELKELGYEQCGTWRYEQKDTYHPRYKLVRCPTNTDAILKRYVAPTVAELGKALPIGFTTYFDGQGWYSLGTNPLSLLMPGDFKSLAIHADTEANCRARMLIYLIKEGIVKL